MLDIIRTVRVIGLGVMGFDIAFLYAQRGYRTLVYDDSEAAVKTLVPHRDQTIERLKRRNRISEIETESVKNALVPVVSLADMTSAALVTEAVSESAKIKKSVYSALQETGFTGVLTTNTSSLTRTSLLDHNEYPDGKFATTHFLIPCSTHKWSKSSEEA